MSKLSNEELSILDHTVNRAAGQRYCGGSLTMDSLVEKGFMLELGKVSWCPDTYYTITDKGREALKVGNNE